MENRPENDAAAASCDFTAPDAKILAVDDNQFNLTIVKLFLKRTGIQPEMCDTGGRAVELCRKTKYDLILLDHMMPQPDGIETLHLIRNDAASLNKDTKAVVFTANVLAGNRRKYLEQGFDDYLTKPLDAVKLEQTVKNLLPKEKVIGISDKIPARPDAGTPGSAGEDMSPLKKRLTAIEGLDYDTALGYCMGEEDFLEQIIAEIASGCAERAERMKKDLEAKDIRSYGIDAHAIKSTMATIGLNYLSERAKKHEFAAKDNDTGFIYEDAEDFISAYTSVCKKLES